jgi:predicted ATP-dependent endonuclease of OLD family
MKLITNIRIAGFRSIREADLEVGTDLTAFAGLNNSGKSNVLRALNAFFNNETDVGQSINVDRDYYRPDLQKKKRKRIRVSIRFELPTNFKFRKGLDAAKNLLGGKSFTVTKEWIRDNPAPILILNDRSLSLDEHQKVTQFLQMIKYRYIPNRVLPTELIRSEHQSLRNVLVRRLAKRPKGNIQAFDEIRETSVRMIESLSRRFEKACPGQGTVSLATPTSWQDLAFTFGYRLSREGVEIEDTAQGAGIQSLLMLETLYLIDRDYFQQFGWRQAAIWGLEEPESSLHTSLEAHIASYLSEISSNSQARLQVFCTTHSDLVLRYSHKPIIVSLQKGETKFVIKDREIALQEVAKLGISRWTHPILLDRLHPIVLVEGKYDCAFLEQAFRLLAPQETICVSYLERLQGDDATGGAKHLQQYIKANASAIKTRGGSAPVIVLLDWDSAKKAEEFKKGFQADDPYRIEVWPENAFNPKLGRSFHGIERHMSDRIIDAADHAAKIIAKKRDGTKVIPRDADYENFKTEVHKVVEKGILQKDLSHVKEFLKKLLASIKERK